MEVLAGILRVANALDRSHFGVIKGIECEIGAKSLELLLTTTEDAALEVWAARERTETLAEALRREITFKIRPVEEAES